MAKVNTDVYKRQVWIRAPQPAAFDAAGGSYCNDRPRLDRCGCNPAAQSARGHDALTLGKEHHAGPVLMQVAVYP